MPTVERAATEPTTLSVNDAADGIAGLLSRQRGTEDASERAGPPNAGGVRDTEVEDEDREPEPEERADDSETEGQDVEEQAETDDEPEAESTDADAETEEQEADEPPPPTKHRVRVDGQEVEVTYDELVAGYSRTADYTRKTQKLSTRSKEIEATAKEIAERRQAYDERLKSVEDALASLEPREPDWDRLRQENPAEYAALHADWKRFHDRKAAVTAERERVAREAHADTLRSRAEIAQAEYDKLVNTVPEWRDTAKREADFAKLAETARSYGYDDEDINSLVDSRTVLLLRDAMRYQEMERRRRDAKGKIDRGQRGRVAPARPGSPNNRNRPPTPAEKAARRLAKTGDVEDAAAALLPMLQAQRRRKGGARGE